MEQQASKNLYSKDDKLNNIYTALFESFKDIAQILRYSSSDKSTNQANQFGDIQLDSDVKSDELIFQHLKASGAVTYALSEEKPELNDMGGDGYMVTFDPLDGSSIIGVNWTVGSIFAIWKSDERKLIGQSGRDIVGGGLCCYGPRTTCLIYNDIDEQVHEYSIRFKNNAECWEISRQNLKIKEKGKIFAPGNLRAVNDHPGYKKLVDFWTNNKYTLRYTGGMAPDIYQLFIKGEGVFTNIATKQSPAKLRLLYEVAPLSYLVEKAGGKSAVQDGEKSILDIEITGYDQRCGIMVGSVEEINRAIQYLNE